MQTHQNYFNECFEYQNGNLVWKNRPISHFKRIKDCKMRNTRFAGKVAGGNHPDGYIQIKLDSTLYLAHRIIWIMHYGEITDPLQVDHINHIRNDNRIENLRLVTHQDNSKNCSKNAKNISGTVGVYFHKAANKWCAQIGKQYLGTFLTKSEAEQARKKAERIYGFHANHGEQLL